MTRWSRAAVAHRLLIVHINERPHHGSISETHDQRIIRHADAWQHGLRFCAPHRLAGGRRMNRERRGHSPTNRERMIGAAVTIDRIGDDDRNPRAPRRMRNDDVWSSRLTRGDLRARYHDAKQKLDRLRDRAKRTGALAKEWNRRRWSALCGFEGKLRHTRIAIEHRLWDLCARGGSSGFGQAKREQWNRTRDPANIMSSAMPGGICSANRPSTRCVSVSRIIERPSVRRPCLRVRHRPNPRRAVVWARKIS